MFQSPSLRAELLKQFWERLFTIPRGWRLQIVVGPRYDTPVHAACAGFWHLRTGSVDQAVAAFAVVRSLPHGEELYVNTQALVAATQCQSLEQISNWQPPECPPGELLRPQVRAAFEELAKVAEAIALVQHSRSIRQQNSALNRASGTLNDLPKQLSDCPDPERTLFEQIVRQWLKIVLTSASTIGTLEVHEPVASPYIAGAPVPAHRLAGRQDSFDQIAAAWNKPGQRDSLVIFGHRRMGKSSIVRNLLHFCPFGEDTGLAVLTLQTVP